MGTRGLPGATDIVKHTRRLAKEQSMTVRVVGLVQDADDRLILGARLSSHTTAGEAVIRDLGPRSAEDVAEADLVVVLVRDVPTAGASGHVAEVLARRAHTVVVATLSEPASEDEVAARLDVPAHVVVLAGAADVMPLVAAEKAIRLVGDRKLALCAAFPVFREAGTREVITATAWQNAAVATILAVPGADMPVLTANQIKMVLRLAALYGESIGFERAKEILAVVGSGFVLRTVARELLGFIPALGWAIKGAVAYSGTVALGLAARRYFDMGPGGRRRLAQKVRERARVTLPVKRAGLDTRQGASPGDPAASRRDRVALPADADH